MWSTLPFYTTTWDSNGACEQVPFPDEYFDAVVCALVLCSVTDVDQSLIEARRVLRAGGRLIF